MPARTRSAAMVCRWSAAAVAVAAVLAGCAAGPASNKVNLGGGTSVTLQSVTNTLAGTGGITGVLVDEAIRPIGRAHVLLGGGLNQSANTTADGLFAFTDLEPGL